MSQIRPPRTKYPTESFSNTGNIPSDDRHFNDILLDVYGASSPNDYFNPSLHIASSNTNHSEASRTNYHQNIRFNNERMHQMEMRSMERNDHVTRELITNKFKLLFENLIAMGFSPEDSVLALMENNWRLKNSIHWLRDRNTTMENARQELTHGLNIDDSNKLTKIIGLARRFNCMTEEVERIATSYDGDLQKTEFFLMSNQPQYMRSKFAYPFNIQY